MDALFDRKTPTLMMLPRAHASGLITARQALPLPVQRPNSASGVANFGTNVAPVAVERWPRSACPCAPTGEVTDPEIDIFDARPVVHSTRSGPDPPAATLRLESRAWQAPPHHRRPWLVPVCEPKLQAILGKQPVPPTQPSCDSQKSRQSYIPRRRDEGHKRTTRLYIVHIECRNEFIAQHGCSI